MYKRQISFYLLTQFDVIVTGGRDRERERRQLGHLGLSDPTVFISSFDRLVLVGCALCEYEWID